MKLPEKFNRRLVMTIAGVLLCAISVGFFRCAAFGVDPFQCFAMGSWGKIGAMLAYGTYYAGLSLVLLVIDLILDKHYIGIATFINLFLTGYVIAFAEGCIRHFAPQPGLALRGGFLIFGVVLLCFSSSLYMTSDLGVSVYDAIPIIVSKRSGFQFRFVRIFCDLICVIVGTICVVLGAKDGQLPGIGTIITAFFMGPLIDVFNKKFSEPLLRK